MFGIGESSSTTNAPQTGATGQGKVLSGKDSSYVESGGLEVKQNSTLKLIQAGGVDLSGNGNKSIQSGGLAVSGGGAVTVNNTTSDKDVSLAAINSANSLSDKFGTTLADLVAKQTAAAADSTAQTLGAISGLATAQQTAAVNSADSTATGGVSIFKNVFLWLGLGLLVVVAIIASNKSK